MTSDERAQILVTARLLSAAASIQWLAAGLTLLAAAAVVHGRGVRAAIAAIVLGLVVIFHCVRISFDAKLFEDIAAERLSESELDAALGTLRKMKAHRSWGDRCRGARRLVALSTIAGIAQVIAVVLIRWS